MPLSSKLSSMIEPIEQFLRAAASFSARWVRSVRLIVRRGIPRTPGGRQCLKSCCTTASHHYITITPYGQYFAVVWPAPRQVVAATITNGVDGYAQVVHAALQAAGLRAELDLRNEKIGYKVRGHSHAQVPVLLVVGRREADGRQVVVRRLGAAGAGAGRVCLRPGQPKLNRRTRQARPTDPQETLCRRHVGREPVLGLQRPTKAAGPMFRLPVPGMPEPSQYYAETRDHHLTPAMRTAPWKAVGNT
ncbi:MAG: hypothetical protein F4X98_00640 [Gammaproteobacteria bacterium]|nr:hypothetical protein [Gammaproteobacteria bacterium]